MIVSKDLKSIIRFRFQFRLVGNANPLALDKRLDGLTSNYFLSARRMHIARSLSSQPCLHDLESGISIAFNLKEHRPTNSCNSPVLVDEYVHVLSNRSGCYPLPLNALPVLIPLDIAPIGDPLPPA